MKIVEFEAGSELENIENYSFHKTSINTIYIPSEVKNIGKNSFSECKYLNEMDIHYLSEL